MTKISSFFSFKGGTGRSMTLANTAVELARRGRRVLCIDLDVEAPGLANIFGMSDGDTPSTLELLIDPSDVRRVYEGAVPLRNILGDSFEGGVWLLPAKHEAVGRLSRVVWDEESLRGFNQYVVTPLIVHYRIDHVLVDSRSGITNPSVMALTLANHYLVLCLRLDRQSRVGTVYARKLFEGIPVPQLLVASNVPQTPRAEAVLKDVEKALGRRVDVSVPLEPDLLIEEEMLSLSRVESPTAKGYQRLAQVLDK